MRSRFLQAKVIVNLTNHALQGVKALLHGRFELSIKKEPTGFGLPLHARTGQEKEAMEGIQKRVAAFLEEVPEKSLSITPEAAMRRLHVGVTSGSKEKTGLF